MQIWVQVQWEPFWSKMKFIIKKLWFTKSLVQFHAHFLLREAGTWISAIPCHDITHTCVYGVPYRSMSAFCFCFNRDLVIFLAWTFGAHLPLVILISTCHWFHINFPLMTNFTLMNPFTVLIVLLFWNQTPSYFLLSHPIVYCVFLMLRFWDAINLKFKKKLL